MSAATLLTSMLEYKRWANGKIFTELEKLTNDKEQCDQNPILRLLNHIYVVDQIFAAHLSGRPHTYTTTNTTETPSLEALRHAVTESDRWYIEYALTLAEKDFSESLEFTFTDGAAGRMSREQIIAHVATHGDYHRGAVGLLMSQLSLSPPESFAGYLHRTEDH